MNKHLLRCGAVLGGSVLLAAGGAQAASLALSCGEGGNAGPEAKRIKATAAGVVKRQSKHVLRVDAAGKSLTFADKPPFDEPLAGERYEFCERKEGFILLAHANGDEFTGKLVNEATGKVTPGGDSVLFSADRRAYFATSQDNGRDGATWSIYALDGRRCWTGGDYLPHPVKPEYKAAELSAQRWEANGEFSAQAQCIESKLAPWRVRLVKSGGAWDWQPKRKCPDA